MNRNSRIVAILFGIAFFAMAHISQPVAGSVVLYAFGAAFLYVSTK